MIFLRTGVEFTGNECYKLPRLHLCVGAFLDTLRFDLGSGALHLHFVVALPGVGAANFVATFLRDFDCVIHVFEPSAILCGNPG